MTGWLYMLYWEVVCYRAGLEALLSVKKLGVVSIASRSGLQGLR